jgi:hypothetical protein
MERTPNPASTATPPNAARAPLDTNGPGSFDEQDRQGRNGPVSSATKSNAART